MREHEYRALVVLKEHWVYGDYLTQHKDGKTKHYIIAHPYGRDNSREIMWEVKPKTVGEFTGLRDKAGVKIFEGDYCRSDYYLFGELVEGVVEFTHTGQYVLAQGSFKNSIHELVFNNWELEVIGNIWENPELVPVQDTVQDGDPE